MSMTVTWTLGELLAKARKDAGLDQAQLSTLAGVARNSISNYETGRSVPPFDVAVRIAQACGTSLDWLASAVNAEPAPAVAGAGSVLSQHSVRPEGLEPPTFCFGDMAERWDRCPCQVNEYHWRGDCPFGCSCGWCAPEMHDAFWSGERALMLASLWRQVEVDAEIASGIGSAS